MKKTCVPKFLGQVLCLSMKIGPWAHCPKILTISNMVDSKIVLPNGSLVTQGNLRTVSSGGALLGRGIFVCLFSYICLF